MLLKLKEKFDEALDVLPIMIGHSIHYELWDIFKYSRHYFDLRFEIDCYKIIYLNLLGLRVSDIFIKSATQRILGDYFLYYKRKIKPKHVDKKHFLSKAVEERMEDFPGGKEFARELFQTAAHTKLPQNPQNAALEAYQLELGDQLLQDKVELHMSDPPLCRSFLDSNPDKKFNCVKLSPMLCGYIDSTTVSYKQKQVPFKVRHLTPHKSQIVEETAPHYVKVLKTHCEEKRCQSAAKLKRDTERNRAKKGRIGDINSKSGLDLSTSDPYSSKYYDDAFKTRSKLTEAFPVKLLYSNRSKYGL